MHIPLRLRTTVLPGCRIVITDPALREGEAVEVTVMAQRGGTESRSALDIINSVHGHRLYATPEAVDAYIAEQRASWDH